jgi:branched-chain amino acid transport system permease protein
MGVDCYRPRLAGRRAGLSLVLLGAFLAIPSLGSAYVLQLATDVLTFTTLAYSWNLISGFTGYLSFGQVSFFGLGAYITALLVLRTPTPWYLAAVAAGVGVGLAALMLGTVMLRLRGILFALGMAGVARILAVAVSDWPFAGDSVGLTLPSQLTPFAVYVGTAAVALAAFGLNVCFARSGFGLDAMSVRDDEEAAAAVGVPTTRVKVSAFILSALLPAVAGGLVAWNRSFIDPLSAFDPALDLQTVVFVLVGGIGTVWGPLVGTVVLSLLGEQFLVYFPDLELALFGALVIAVVLVLPGGLVSLAHRFARSARPPILAPRTLSPRVARHSRATATGRAILEVQDLTVRFGGVLALDRVSLAVRRGETVSIIGANGAGKTTLFNAITGFVTASSGDIRYEGESITRLRVFQRAQRGIARTFQIPRLMDSMSVWENVLLASRHGRQSDRAVDHATWTLHSTALEAMWLAPAKILTPGLRRRLELARALALDPEVILLDEVMAGMTSGEQEQIRGVVRRIHELGVTVICVEHVISAIADLSDRMVVLDFGRKIAEGRSEVVLSDPRVVRAYLGEPQ